MSLSSSTVDFSALVVVLVDSCEISVVFRLSLNVVAFPLPLFNTNSAGISCPTSLVSVSLVLGVPVVSEEVAFDFGALVFAVPWKIYKSCYAHHKVTDLGTNLGI